MWILKHENMDNKLFSWNHIWHITIKIKIQCSKWSCSVFYLLTPWLRATVLVELRPPHTFYVRFHDSNFLQDGVISPMPNPNLEDQGISLSLAPPSKPVRHGWPYQQLCCCQHSFIVHWCTQAPHPVTKCFQQGGDTIEVACLVSHTAMLQL
jgi:hypothetical protein